MRAVDRVAISPDGHNVYVSSVGGVAVFRRAADGSLRQLAGRSGCVLAAAGTACQPRPPWVRRVSALAVSPDGRNVYLIVASSAQYSNALLVFLRDARTGALTPTGGQGGCISAAFHDDCQTQAGFNGSSWEFSIAISPNGKNLYVGSGDGVASFNRAMDGRLKALAGADSCRSASDWTKFCVPENGTQPYTDITVSPDGRNVYFAHAFGPAALSGTLTALIRNPSTGALSFLSCEADTGRRCVHTRGLGDVSGLAVAADGDNLYAVGMDGGIPPAARLTSFRRR